MSEDSFVWVPMSAEPATTNVETTVSNNGPLAGPKYLDMLGREADDSRNMVDILCRRLLKPDFDSGRVSGRVDSMETLHNIYIPPTLDTAVLHDDREHLRRGVLNDIFMRLIKPSEMEQAMQRLQSWQDTIDMAHDDFERSTLSRILLKNPKFPTVQRVKILLGEEMADSYTQALEHMEANPILFAEFPSERVSGGWNRLTAERAVSLVVDVIEPHAEDSDGMAIAYGRFMEEFRSQVREKKLTTNVKKDERRAAAKALGIWLPTSQDMYKWEIDPRTQEHAQEFGLLVIKVYDKMRIMRSVLQFIPRRKFATRTVEDLLANMERMRDYIKDNENKTPLDGYDSTDQEEDHAPPAKRGANL